VHRIQTFRPDGLSYVTGAAVIWGTIGVATQAIYTLDNATSLFINLARMLIATPLLGIMCWYMIGNAMFRILGRDFLVMVVTGALLAISQAAYLAAIRLTGVTIATLLTICVAPVVVTSLSVLLRFETLTKRGVLALLFALLGSVLLVGRTAPSGVDDNLILGTIFALASAVTYACMILCGRFLASHYHPLQVTAVTFGAGTLLLLLISLGSGMVAVHTTSGWVLVVYLGLVPTAMAYWMFQKGLRSVSASAASIVTMLDPLVAALLAWVLFGETLAFTGLFGAMLVILSIVVLSVGKKA